MGADLWLQIQIMQLHPLLDGMIPMGLVEQSLPLQEETTPTPMKMETTQDIAQRVEVV